MAAARRTWAGRVQREIGSRQIVKASSNVVKMNNGIITATVRVMGSKAGLEPLLVSESSIN